MRRCRVQRLAERTFEKNMSAHNKHVFFGFRSKDPFSSELNEIRSRQKDLKDQQAKARMDKKNALARKKRLLQSAKKLNMADLQLLQFAAHQNQVAAEGDQENPVDAGGDRAEGDQENPVDAEGDRVNRDDMGDQEDPDHVNRVGMEGDQEDPVDAGRDHENRVD